MDIFFIRTDGAENVSEDLLKQFQKKEISDKKTFVVHCYTYLMLDRILKEVYKIEDRTLLFINKKPYLKSGKKYFSVSHSGEYIAIGFSDFDCGIDIEYVNPDKNWKSIAKRMKFNSHSLKEFYLDWTRYEAEYKLDGDNKSIYQTNIGNYELTAISNNDDEKYELYFQY